MVMSIFTSAKEYKDISYMTYWVMNNPEATLRRQRADQGWDSKNADHLGERVENIAQTDHGHS